MKITPGSKLVMIGDSITDCERARPVGEGPANALGNGYVTYIDALLGAAHPDGRIRVVNMGVSGNTVRDLRARWESDVLGLNPDWLSIMIGINDVWRQFDRPLMTEQHVGPEEYDRTLGHIIDKVRPRLQGLLLATPFYIEPNPADPMRTRMDEYGAIVRKHADRCGALFVDTQAAFDAALKHHYPAKLAADRVHPTHIGHMILARSFLNALDFTW